MQVYIEIFGYIGSVLVVVSMLMSSVVKLRIINTAGSVISAIYALIIQSFPLALMNICLIIINLYNLRKVSTPPKHHELVRADSSDAYVQYFLRHYGENIHQFFPDFDGNGSFDRVYLLFCNGENAGIFMGTETQPGRIAVALDYTTPTYRDCSVGKFLYGALPAEGVRELRMAAPSAGHLPYLQKMGYRQTDKGYYKDL